MSAMAEIIELKDARDERDNTKMTDALHAEEVAMKRLVSAWCIRNIADDNEFDRAEYYFQKCADDFVAAHAERIKRAVLKPLPETE
jgi:hypothetical protein